MRIRWRGLELPNRVALDDAVSTDYYGLFVVEPFERGFGTTIGNALRRVLLSSLEGAAVTTVKIAKVPHEFMSIEGVVEDVTDILLNIKGIVLKYDGEGPKTVSVQREKAGDVTAGDIVCDPAIKIVNPGHKIATLTADASFQAEMTVRSGRGYATAQEHRTPDLELGTIPIDAVFSPVVRVRYRTEDMRVGQRTNYDRLILEVWTNGTVLPEDALVEAGLILRKHLNPFVMYYDLGDQTVARPRPPAEINLSSDAAKEELLSRPISSLKLSVRAANCLESAKLTILRDLVACSGDDLQRIRSFGKTSLQEVQRKLSELGLSLGVSYREEGAGASEGSSGSGSDLDSGGSGSFRGGGVGSSGDGLGRHQGETSATTAGSAPMQVFTMPE